MRYLAAIGRWQERALAPRLAQTFCLETVVAAANLLVLRDPATPACPIGGGALLGDIFRRGETSPTRAFDPERQRAIATSGGTILIQTCWGSYIAILPHDDGATLVLRAPLGALPALHATSDGLTLIASDMTLLAAAMATKPAIDWSALACHLAQPELRRSATCLAGISEVQGGYRLRVDWSGTATATLWSPWTCLDKAPFDDWLEAQARVRDATRLSVAAIAGPGRALLLLSGGLDSSVVAACLAHAGADFSCLNLVTDGLGGDETHYARAVAERLGVALEIARPDLAHVDILASAAAGQPRPTKRCFEQALDQLSDGIARAHNATAVIDGGGGDNVFYALLSVAPVADALIRFGPGARFRQATAALADLAQTSMVRVAARAALRAWRGGAAPIPAAIMPLLSAAAHAAIAAAPLHPWLAPPPGTLPGKASHVAMLAAAQGLVEGSDPTRPVRESFPLLSQPVVETCLRVASDLWFAPGLNRAVARTAFAADLPDLTIARRSKGSPGGFVALLFEAHRCAIRAMLLDGTLAAHGIIDPARVAAALDVGGPARGAVHLRILELVDAEAWARHWR